MSDIFREVDEDIRREQIKRLWDRFGIYVLGAAILIVVVTAGWRGWEYWQSRQAAATGDRFLAALQLANDGKHDDAIKAFQSIIDNGSGGYPALARFRVAAEKALAGDKTGAVAEFDAISPRSATRGGTWRARSSGYRPGARATTSRRARISTTSSPTRTAPTTFASAPSSCWR
jgi:hypothetical protein